MSELFHSFIIIGSIIPQYYGRRNGECSDNIQKNLQRSADGPFFFSGHGGGLDGKTVLAAIDYNYDGKMGTSASLYLEAMAAAERKIVLLNCCREE